MADLLTRISIARQRREPVDAAWTYKRLLSLGHTPEQADAAMDAEAHAREELLALGWEDDELELWVAPDGHYGLQDLLALHRELAAMSDTSGRDAECQSFAGWRELHGEPAPGEGV